MIVTFPQVFIYQSFDVDDTIDVINGTQEGSQHLERDLNILRSVVRRLRGVRHFTDLDDEFLQHLGGKEARTARQGALFFWYEGVNRIGEPQYRVSPTRPTHLHSGARFYPQYPFDGDPVTITEVAAPYVTTTQTNTWLGSPLTSARTNVLTISSTRSLIFTSKF